MSTKLQVLQVVHDRVRSDNRRYWPDEYLVYCAGCDAEWAERYGTHSRYLGTAAWKFTGKLPRTNERLRLCVHHEKRNR